MKIYNHIVVCAANVDRYKQYTTPIRSGIASNRRLRRLGQWEWEQIVNVMEINEQWSFRQLIKDFQIKHWMYGFHVLLKNSMIFHRYTFVVLACVLVYSNEKDSVRQQFSKMVKFLSLNQETICIHNDILNQFSFETCF